MTRENNVGKKEPEVIVEYYPRKRQAGAQPPYGYGPGAQRRYFFHYSTRRVSPLKLALLAVAGGLVFCLLLAVGAVMLLLALGAGIVYMICRTLTRR